MPFFNNPNIGNLNNVQPLVEEEEKKSSTFLTSPPIEEPIEQPEPQPFGFLSSAPAQMEPQTIPQSLGYDYNIADFRNNKEVQEAWERFYDSAELNNYDNDVVEYLRDVEYSVGATGVRSKQIKNWGEQTRKDYTTLQRAFRKANGLGNAKERFKFAGNLASDILLDPVNWVGLAFAIPTMGGSLTVNAAAQAALRVGLNKGVKSQLKKEAIKNTGSIALYGTAEGVTWGGAYEYFSQEADKEIGIQQGPTDWKKVGQVAALGGAFGAVVPGAIGGISNSLFLRKLYNFSNEDNIYSQAAKLAIDSEKVIDVNMSDPSTKIVFFKNQKGSKGRQKKGSELEIVPLTRRTYKQYIVPQAKAVGKETFEEVNSFQKFLKFNDVIEENAFLVIRHGKNKAGRITKQVEPMTEMNGRLSAVSKEYLEEYFNVPTRRQYWKQVGSFRDKDAITHTQIDDQSVEGLLYARQAGISQKEISERAAKYGIDIEDVDAAGYKQFKEMVQDNANLDATDVKLTLLHKLISQTVGKATTKYLKLAENNDALVEYLESLVPGATNKLFKRRKTGVNEFTYGETKGNSDGFYLTNLEIALNRSGKTGIHAMITPEENDQLLALMMSGGKVKTYGGKKISQTSKTAYFGDGKNIMGIKKLLKHAFDEGDESGLFAFTGQVKNYFPQKLQHSKIEADRLGFEDTIIRAGHADPINDVVPTKFFNSKGELIDGFDLKSMPKDKEIWGRDFLAEAGENLDKARELKAAAIVDDMLERRWTPYTDNALQGIPDIIKGGHSFMKHRVFDKVPHVEMLPYIETDVAKVLQDYFVNFSQANVRTKMYGKNVPAMYKDGGIFRRIEDEFLAKGGDRTQVRQVMDKLEEMHKLVTGLDHNTIQNNAVRTLSDWGKLSQQMAHLPLATLSSLTEPLLLLSRARAGDVGNVAYDIGHAMKKQTIRTFDRMAQQSKRVKGETTRGLKEFDDEEWVEIYKTGLALEQATMDRIEGLTGEALSSGLAKNLQNAFFKTNLLTQWTSAVQLAAFTTGKRLIKQNAESLYLHNAGIKKLGKKKVQYLSDQLEELGIPLDQANDWYKKYLSKDGVFDVASANKDIFYKQRLVRGANRFTREIILNPSTSSANRPLWFSHPAGQLLMQFAGYPTVFNNTVLKRFVNEAAVYPLQTTPKILATTMLMTSVAMMGNYIRSGGRNFEDQEPAELITRSIRRWGGFGALEYFDKTSTNLELGSGQLGSILKAGGPLMGDAIDALIYRKGITEFATTNIPGYSALPKETRDYLKKIGRDRDKALVEFLLSVVSGEEKASFARGGIVDVPNAKDEPDEMINKLTGLPYNATSASVQDIEDRERRASGSEGAEKRELPDALKPLENLVATIQGKVREVREGNKKLLETSKEILSSPSFRLYADAVIKRKKEPITNDWFSDQEYATIKESLKSVFKHPQKRLDFYKTMKSTPAFLPRAYDESKNISKTADKVNMLFRWGYDGQIAKEGKPISLYETLGTSTLKIPHKQPYNSAVLEVYDKYDFNSQHGGSGTYFEQAKNIVKNVLSGEAYRAESAAMQLAEKYGALVLPDDYTAAKENREPKFVPVNIQVPVSEVMDEDTWKSYQSSITYKEPEPTSNVMQERKFQDRKGFESGGVTDEASELASAQDRIRDTTEEEFAEAYAAQEADYARRVETAKYHDPQLYEIYSIEDPETRDRALDEYRDFSVFRDVLPMIPVNVKQYAYHMMGGKGALDVNDLTEKELKVLYQIAQEKIDSGGLSVEENSTVMVDYPDYKTEGGYADIVPIKNLGMSDEELEEWKTSGETKAFPSGRKGTREDYTYDEYVKEFPGLMNSDAVSVVDIAKNLTDSKHVMKTTTGKADINYNKDSNTITITDDYNHNSTGATTTEIIGALLEDPSLYAAAKAGAQILNRDGTPVEIDLGSPEFVKNYDTTFASGGPVTGLRKKLKQRQGFKSGGVSGVVQRVIDLSGKAMGVGASEQRANEKQAAALVNQMVAAGTVPKYEYVPVDDYGFVLPANQGGSTGDAFEAVNHGLLSATYGDSMFMRGALQAKEIGQGLNRPLDSKRDSYNNRVGFKIRETAKTPEEITREINNRIIRSYEKMKSGEALIPGEDFFLNPNEMEL